MKRTKSISISSGKGGVGKTTMVANLAVALSERGRKVLILDGDLGMANVDILFGTKTDGNLYEVLKGEKELREIVTPVLPGVDLIPGGSGIVELNRLSNFERKGLINAVSELEGRYDYMLIDTSPGITDNVLQLNAAADECVMVITPDAASLADSYALIKVLNHQNGVKHFSIITNEVRNETEGLTLFNRFNDITNKFLYVGLDYLGSVPTDSQVKRVIQGQRLIMRHNKNSEAAQAITRIAAQLESESLFQDSKTGLQFFWEQVVGVA